MKLSRLCWRRLRSRCRRNSRVSCHRVERSVRKVTEERVANVKFSGIAASGVNATVTDQILGVHAGTTDLLFTPPQIQAALSLFTTSAPGLAPTSPGGSTAFLRADGQWVSPGGIANGVAHGIAITNSATSVNSAIVLGAGQHIVGVAGADPTTQTVAQLTATLGVFSSVLQGVVPASGGGTTTFLRADGSWASPSSASGITGGTVHGVAITTAALNVFTTALQGLTPASGGGTTNFLRADGSWAVPPSGGSGITGGVIHGIALTNSA